MLVFFLAISRSIEQNLSFLFVWSLVFVLSPELEYDRLNLFIFYLFFIFWYSETTCIRKIISSITLSHYHFQSPAQSEQPYVLCEEFVEGKLQLREGLDPTSSVVLCFVHFSAEQKNHGEVLLVIDSPLELQGSIQCGDDARSRTFPIHLELPCCWFLLQPLTLSLERC